MASSLETLWNPPATAAGYWKTGLRLLISFVARCSIEGLAWGLSLGCCFAVVLQLSIKDSIPAFAPYFYATPWVLIWSGFALSSLLFLGLRKPSLGILTGLAAMICWGVWQQTHVFANPANHEVQSTRVVFWNTARFQAGWQPMAREIVKLSAPIMGFVEAGPDEPADRERWLQEFPKHRPVFFGNGMVLLIQGQLLATSQGKLGKGSYYGRATVELQGQRMTILLVDIYSSPFVSREPALTALREATLEFADEPAVLMGDFNTPTDSVLFYGLREQFSNAFEVSGIGHDATWPSVCPLLSIDQIWFNRHIQVHQTRYHSCPQSDHRAVLTEFSLSR